MLSIPIKKIVTKNPMDQKGAKGIWARASGYTLKTRPGPGEKFVAGWIGENIVLRYMNISRCKRNLK